MWAPLGQKRVPQLLGVQFLVQGWHQVTPDQFHGREGEPFRCVFPLQSAGSEFVGVSWQNSQHATDLQATSRHHLLSLT